MILPRLLLPLLFLSISVSQASIASTQASSPQLPHLAIDQQTILAKKENALQLRGGAGFLDPLQTAKFMTYFISCQALLMNLTPGFLFNVYGGTHSPLNHRLVQTYGTGVLGVLIMAYCLLMRDTSLAMAYRYSEVPWIVECLRNLWKEKHSQAVGFTMKGQLTGMAISALIMYATTQDYAYTALKIVTVFWLLNGLYLIANPERAAKSLWGAFPTFDATSKLMARMIGFNMLAHSGMAGSLLFVNSTDKLKAFGIGYSSWFWKLVWLQILTGDAQAAGFDRRLVYFWILVHGAIVATILL